MTIKIAMLYERVRWEEKAIKKEAESRSDVEFTPINILDIILKLFDKGTSLDHDIFLQRAISLFKGLYCTAILEFLGKTVVNDFNTSVTCGDKLLSTLAFLRKGIPTPRTVVAFSEASALKAIEEVGYPAILKPIHGSWGRLIAPLNDPLSAKAIIESRLMLHPIHQVFYIQERVKRPPRDIRSFVIGDQVVAAIYRIAAEGEWRTNTSLGGKAEPCKITPEIEEMSLKAAEAVGGGILGIDMMESPDGLVVHEVNHVIEFRNTVPATGVNIPKLIVDYLVNKVRR